MKRPYIALGVTQQGRTTPTLLQRMAARVIADDPHDGPPDAATRPSPLTPISQSFDWGHPTLMYAVVAALLIALLALGGCGGSADPLDPQADQATTQPVDCITTPERCR